MDKIDTRRASGEVKGCNLCGEISNLIGKLRGALENGEVWLNAKDPNKQHTWKCPK